MTTDKPYWEQDIAECLRVAAEIIGPNSYYLRAAEYIEEMRDRISKLEGSIITLESECNQLNDMPQPQRTEFRSELHERLRRRLP